MLSSRTLKFISWGIFFHLCAVIFSIGFFNHDEQRQVLQMVGLKLSMFDQSYLDYQYTAEIRSWLHPAMYVWIGKIYSNLNNPNPFHLAFLFRLFSSGLGCFSLWTLYLTFKEELSEIADVENYFYLSAFLWFIPFIHARTSNENIATSFFVFGLYFCKNQKTFKDSFLAGFIWSATFFIRFQLAFMIIPAIIWSIFFKKCSIKNFIQFCLGFLSMMLINTIIDYHYYGNLTFTPWNYIQVNFIEHYLAQFGTSPIYEYIKESFRQGFPPLSLFYIIGVIVYWYRNKSNLLTAITFPFFMIHSLIGHKELRFIFPLIMLLPIILTFLMKDFAILSNKKIKTYFFVFNIPVLIYICFVPASNLTAFYQHLYYKEKIIDSIYTFMPYEDYVKFYRKVDIKYHLIKETDISKILDQNNFSYFISTTNTQKDLLLNYKFCKLDYSLNPTWINEISFLKNSAKFKKWTFIECQK